MKTLDLLGVVSPGMHSLAEPGQADLPYTKTLLPGGVIGVAGAMGWKKHRVLGFLAGESLGQNTYRLYRGQGGDRVRALTNMGMTGAAVAGSLLWKKHPFWGFVAGLAAGTVATSFVPGSNAHRVFRR